MSHRPAESADTDDAPSASCRAHDAPESRSRLERLSHLKRRSEDRFGNLAYAIQFGAVGISGMVVDLGLYAVLLKLLPLAPARALAIWVAMTWNFLLNRYVTFARVRRRSIWRQYVGFCLSCAAGAAVNFALSVGLASKLPPLVLWQLLAASAGILAGFGLNFALCRLWVFRTHGEA